jgi:hypothetical protein
VAAEAWHRTGAAEEACLGSLERAWGHQALVVVEYQSDVPCPYLRAWVREGTGVVAEAWQAWEYRALAVEEHQNDAPCARLYARVRE